ncbi:MAG: FAD-binding protein [Bacteroidota bacterium]
MENSKPNFLTRNRGLIIFLIVVPVSFTYQKLQDLSNWFYRVFKATNKLHDKKVNEIQSQVAQAYSEGRLMCTARAPWKTMSIRKATYKDGLAKIPIDLRNILSLDKESMTLRVEPMVTMADITRHLVPKGYALAVQVEMDDLTVGGLCMGIGIETTSHQYGFLFETIKSYEIITAAGKLVKASKTENPDLYHALPMSHGTLGFLVAVEFEIVSIKKFMKVEYLPFHSMDSFGEELKFLTGSEKPADFVEGLIFSDSEGVIMVGEMVDERKEEKLNSINRWYKPWFYSHIETFLRKGKATEYIPIRHYFHRHTPSMFFQLKDLIPFGNKAWYRWLFAWMGAPKVSLMKYTMTKELRKRSMTSRVAQDLIVPMEHFEESIKLVDEDFGIYPLWVCPVRINDKHPYNGLIKYPESGTSNKGHQMMVDIGIYGIPEKVSKGTWNGVETARKLEYFTRSLGGFQMLYADIFMTRKEFEEMFSHELYREVRSKFNADKAFPEIYNKVIPEKWLIDVEMQEEKGEQEKHAEALEVL